MHLILWLLQTKSCNPLEKQAKRSLLPLRLARFYFCSPSFYFEGIHVQPYVEFGVNTSTINNKLKNDIS